MYAFMVNLGMVDPIALLSYRIVISSLWIFLGLFSHNSFYHRIFSTVVVEVAIYFARNETSW